MDMRAYLTHDAPEDTDAVHTGHLPTAWNPEGLTPPAEQAPDITCPICYGQQFGITGEGQRYCLHCPWEDGLTAG
jgi:hypothetical protein